MDPTKKKEMLASTKKKDNGNKGMTCSRGMGKNGPLFDHEDQRVGRVVYVVLLKEGSEGVSGGPWWALPKGGLQYQGPGRILHSGMERS